MLYVALVYTTSSVAWWALLGALMLYVAMWLSCALRSYVVLAMDTSTYDAGIVSAHHHGHAVDAEAVPAVWTLLSYEGLLSWVGPHTQEHLGVHSVLMVVWVGVVVSIEDGYTIRRHSAAF
uniref:Uncharacterized protein n=1 Tax=Diplonema papillatum TaxID=91374 RepID=A0A1L6C3Z9_9EUGL|nr:hypothetical protein [Diplonema papillatum]